MNGERFALVTGAGSGIGRASALALARAGWHVALAGRRREPLEETAGEIKALGRRAIAAPSDVSDPEAVKALFATIEREFGRLDLLFNNAGPGAPAVPIDELTYAQWKAVVDVNLNGVFLCAQGAFGLMKRQKPQGRADHQQRLDLGPCAEAVVRRPIRRPSTPITGLTKSIALDGRAHDIACGQIDIGNALTEMARKMTQGVPQADGRIAVEPTMDADEVGAAVVHMASLPIEHQHPHHDDHGDQDAVRGAGVAGSAEAAREERLEGRGHRQHFIHHDRFGCGRRDDNLLDVNREANIH